jgi:diketogulonate reductase-like aldo/keto reductase
VGNIIISTRNGEKLKNIGVSNWGINHLEELNDKGYHFQLQIR